MCSDYFAGEIQPVNFSMSSDERTKELPLKIEIFVVKGYAKMAWLNQCLEPPSKEIGRTITLSLKFKDTLLTSCTGTGQPEL